MWLLHTPLLCLLLSNMHLEVVYAKRGPHHPRSEVDAERRPAKVDEHFAHEDEHMQQDLDSAELPYHVNVNEMTDDEKNLYYFKLHDSDNNDALDGLELIQAATHHAHDKHSPDEKTDEDPQTIAEELTHIIDIIDDFITYADFNHDGLLNYAEYSKAINRNEVGLSDKNIEEQLIT